jgi:hypothetical protein
MTNTTIKLDPNEIWPLLNILNEVCHGISINNFENVIGAKKHAVIDLLEKISKDEKKEDPMLSLDRSELTILIKSFDAVFKQIGEWEFQTRIGIPIHEAIRLKNKLILNKQT